MKDFAQRVAGRMAELRHERAEKKIDSAAVRDFLREVHWNDCFGQPRDHLVVHRVYSQATFLNPLEGNPSRPDLTVIFKLGGRWRIAIVELKQSHSGHTKANSESARDDYLATVTPEHIRDFLINTQDPAYTPIVSTELSGGKLEYFLATVSKTGQIKSRDYVDTQARYA